MSAPLLIPEPPLQVLPTLASEVGVNEAIFLQQVHYWSLRARDDEGWVYKTQAEWIEELPWLSTRTLQRVVERLREGELIDTKQPDGTDRKTYYRVAYEALPEAAIVAASGRQSGGLTNTPSENTSDNKGEDNKSVRKKVGRKVVTDSEFDLATAVVASFNTTAGTKLSVDPHLTPIVGRIRERPDLTAEHHAQLIEAVFAGDHWWTDPPGPRIIYGNAAQFEQSLEIARRYWASRSESSDDPGAALNAELERTRKEQGLE